MAKEKANVANEQQEPQKVSNISQAISVLLQATDIGRRAGVYSWEDLELIGQARVILTGGAKQNPKAAEELNNAAESEESEKENQETSTEEIATEE